MIKAIIFDCFGVLITDALNVIMDQQNLAEDKRKDVHGLTNSVNRGIISYSEYRSRIAEILNMSEEKYFKSIKEVEVKNNELLNYILELKDKYKIGLLSNVSGRESLNKRFSDAELNKYFDVVVASGEIGYAKPEARAYEITADRLGVQLNECVMVDDRLNYVDSAIGIGMKAIVYEYFEQTKSELENILN